MTCNKLDPDEFNYNEVLLRALFCEIQPTVTVDSAEDMTVLDEDVASVVESG